MLDSQFSRRYIVVLLLGAFFVGCNQSTVAKKDGDSDDATSQAKSETDDDSGKSYAEQANELFQKAKAAGQTTANNAGEWISDTVSGAMEATGSVAQDTGDWVTDTYESLKDQGLTNANNASEWLQQDIKNINSIEYKTMPKSTENLEAKLNELGAQRWDCFAVDDNFFYLKRKSKSYLRHVPVKDLLKLIPGGGGEE